jgi:hypothetical protein
MTEDTHGTLTAEITLVEHGYQIDITNRSRATGDGNGAIRQSVCRDFGGDYDIAAMADTLHDAMIDLMDNIETIHRERIRQQSRATCPHCGRIRHVNRNGKMRLHRGRNGSPCPATHVTRKPQ